jgi:hypothetical protein
MLDIHCDNCGRVLVGTRQIISMTGTEAGMRIAYVCWCGRPGAELVRRSGARRAHVPSRPAVAAGETAA